MTNTNAAFAAAPMPNESLIRYDELREITCPICDSASYEAVTLRFDKGRIVKCTQCDHKYLNPTLTEDILATIYAGYHESEDDEAVIKLVSAWFAEPEGPYQYVLNQLEQNGRLAGKKVIEVGCGPGRFLYECVQRGAVATGIDISPGAVRLAKKYFGLDLIPKDVQQAISDKDVKPGSYDYLFAFEIIEHLRKPQEFLHALFQLLAPGGQIFISTPNFHLFELMGHAAEVVNKWPEHLHFFEPDTLNQCIARSGFTNIQIISVSNTSFGGRQKQIFASKEVINALWQRARKVRSLYALKDILFHVLDKYEGEADREPWNGRCLVSRAHKPV